MNARILNGLMGASTIVNTLGNRYLPISKLGSYAAWFKRGILPLLNCVNYNIRLAATPMGVYHQASAEGDSTLSQPQKKPSPGVGYCGDKRDGKGWPAAGLLRGLASALFGGGPGMP